MSMTPRVQATFVLAALLSFIAAVIHSENASNWGGCARITYAYWIANPLWNDDSRRCQMFAATRVYWRGTFFPLAKLNQGQRVRL